MIWLTILIFALLLLCCYLENPEREVNAHINYLVRNSLANKKHQQTVYRSWFG